MVSLDSSQLERACAVGRTQWLCQLLAEYLPRLIELSDSPEDLELARQWDSTLKQKFVERGLVSPSQQKNRITDVRNAIKLLDPNHPSLAVVGFTADEWIEINSMASDSSSFRTTQFLASPEAIADTAEQLLKSRIWSEVAAGLAVVTGRRVSEILKTAEFTFKSTYSVMFTGAVKRRDEPVPLTFEIPTLVPAHTVIDAIASLRSWLDTSKMTNRQINDRYERAVAQMCDRHFRDLVPLRQGKDNLYTHLFRAVYATIAAHWFCPPTVSDLEFRAYIQGHFQILHETNTEKRTSMATQRHYWDYKIADGVGNVDGRLGIKLQQEGVRVLEAFERPKATTTSNEDRGVSVHLRVFENDRAHLAFLQSQFDLNNRAEAFHFVLELAQSLLTTADTLNLTPQQLIEKLAHLDSQSLSPSVDEVEPSLIRGDSSDLSMSEKVSLTENQNAEEPTIKEDSAPSDINRTDAVELIPCDAQPQTEELSNQISETSIRSTALFERMDRQQQSLENLTGAIHGLVEVLASNLNSSSLFGVRHSESKTDSDRSGELVQSQPLAPSERKTSDIQVTSSTSDGVKPNRSRKHRSELSRQKVNQFIDRIITYNDVKDRPHSDKWLITIAALKRLTHCGQSVIYHVLKERQDDLQFHHHKHQLGIYHNQKGKNAPPIESVLSLD